jgi:hypothetical protein
MERAGRCSGDGCYPDISHPTASFVKIIDKPYMVDAILRSTDVSIQPQYSNSDCPEQFIKLRSLAPQLPCSTYHTEPTDSRESSERSEAPEAASSH